MNPLQIVPKGQARELEPLSWLVTIGLKPTLAAARQAAYRREVRTYKIGGRVFVRSAEIFDLIARSAVPARTELGPAGEVRDRAEGGSL